METHPDSSDNELRSSSAVHTSSHELQDLLMSSEGEGVGAIAPPARIAARFYRSGNSRRKSSAASSRRNSITSHQSGRSARSAHGGPQSTHTAQHIRRASILETRKARLADKAAHAEKVRLRAAMAKAAPRMSTTSELRAAAAEQARNRHLAQVAAQCAEEVQRAKKVAEDTREKKAAENLKLKGHMEERLAEAERRRLLYQQSQRRMRTTSLAPVEEKRAISSSWKPRNDEEAARLIQKAWRNRTRRRVIQDFLELGLTVEHIRLIPFDDVGGLISSERVLSRTANVLKFCGLQDGEGGPLGERTAVRSFLSAFLILGHPSHVMEHKGVQEQDLIAKAEHLMSSFDSILVRSSTTAQFSPLASQLATLAYAHSSFQTAFAAWKAQDSSILVQSMIAQFVELDAIWQAVKNDAQGVVAEDYREGIERNQAQLLVRLKRLAGPEKALRMVSEAVRASRKAKPRKKRTGDGKPRAMSSEDSSSLPAVESNLSSSRSAERATPDIGQSCNNVGKAVNLIAIPDNRTIIHELAINKEYRIDIKARTDLRDAIIQASYNSIQANLQAGSGDATWILTMVEHLRGKLLGLVKSGSPLYTLISETLESKRLVEQITIGLFSFTQFFAFMITILPKICAPVRDDEVETFASDPGEDPIERLAKLHYVIDLLSLDHANFMIKVNAPLLIPQAATYEQGCFARIMVNSEPYKTQEWWNAAKARTVEAISRRPPEGGSISSTRLTSERIYSQGLVDLAIAVSPLKSGDLPETLELDQERIMRFRSDTLRIITLGLILLTAKNLLRRDTRLHWKMEAQRMWDLPFANAQSFLSLIESGHSMPASSKNALTGTIERILSDARAKHTTHPLMQVMLRKFKKHVMSQLWVSSSEERVKATTSASDLLARIGLIDFVRPVGLMVDELARMREVDRAAHGKWYDEISTVGGSDAEEAL